MFLFKYNLVEISSLSYLIFIKEGKRYRESYILDTFCLQFVKWKVIFHL